MRADLPGAVATAIERCERPALVFDLTRIEANAKAIASAARASGVVVLFAAKSFPHPAVREVAARVLDGFDAASEAELAELPHARIVSVADPTGRAGARVRAERLIVSCETVEQVRAAPAHAEIAIRLSTSLTGRDPAIGAVQDSSGHRRSRFGLDVDPERQASMIRELVAGRPSGTHTTASGGRAHERTRDDARAIANASGERDRDDARTASGERARDAWAIADASSGRRIGLHVHHGPVTATGAERFVATAKAALAVADDAGIAPSFLNLGGAWHAVPDLAAALRDVRAAVPAGIEIMIEPGRALVDEAGFACGRVTLARELDDRALRVSDLSRICHLRWSHVELVGTAPRAGAGRNVLIAGPTCFEEDVIGEWVTEDELAVGTRVIVRHVTGYAVAWNVGFHGNPAAEVVVVS